MASNPLSRGSFVKNSLILGAGLPVSKAMGGFYKSDKSSCPSPVSTPLYWLQQRNSGFDQGITWGVPWKKGALKHLPDFSISGAEGAASPVQSWPLAYWPDGSLKWTAHAISGRAALTAPITLQETKHGGNDRPNAIKIEDTISSIIIDNGIVRYAFAKQGNVIIPSIKRNGTLIAGNGRLVLHAVDNPDTGKSEPIAFQGNIDTIQIEQAGPLRAVIKVKGRHSDAARAWLPFILRFYFYAGNEAVRVMHTIVYDGDEKKDFVAGLGLSLDVPLNDPLYNRHIRFVGDGGGVFSEAIQGLTGLRRDAGKEVRMAQINGMRIDAAQLTGPVADGLQYIPAFGDYTLFQPLADSFEIRKRTKKGYTWLSSGFGSRSAGTGYIGTPGGGLAFGIRNFWQSHPAQLDIHNAQTDTANVTLWLWSPQAQPMDLRFYHDGLGQDTFAKQREGLDVTYEDYEPGFGRPIGVARTSELQLITLGATPSNEELSAFALDIQNPPRLMCTPEYLAEVHAFGDNWSLVDNSSQAHQKIEQQLAFYFDYYKKEIEQRHWYGYWNYGDVMHTYDEDRHVWRYDIGGYAWDNSELSTDLWLWFYFLRTGRADVFHLAEAMTRHTGEVDVHHIGPFSPLGSRHNVLHWGDSAKQLRISTAANRRFYYYLTADERVGGLMHEQVDAYKTLQKIAPGRKLPKGSLQQESNDDHLVNMGFGTDWGAVAAAWFTEWERTGNKEIYDRLINSMTSIAGQPHGFFTGGGSMDIANGKFVKDTTGNISVSHLNAVFGLPEMIAEMLFSIDIPAFEQAWLQYCRLYNAPAREQKAALGIELKKLNLKQGHARLTAFAAFKDNNKNLVQRAWMEFFSGSGGIAHPSVELNKIGQPHVLNAIEEAPGVSTNAVAQWGLAAIQCLAYAGKELSGNYESTVPADVDF